MAEKSLFVVRKRIKKKYILSGGVRRGWIIQVVTIRKAMKSAWELVKLIQSTTADGALDRNERNALNKAFWELANEIRSSNSNAANR